MPLSSLHLIFIFLPLILFLYYLLPNRGWRTGVLFFASLFFFTWADPIHLPLFLFLVFVDYIAGRVIGNLIENNKRIVAQKAMWVAVGLNLAALIFFKYSAFLLDIFSAITNHPIAFETPGLPLGLSFFTFTGIAYILDIYNTAEKPVVNFLQFGAFISMFPKLVEGPITRINQVRQELANPVKISTGNLIEGAKRFISGLAKKVLLADSLGVVSNKILSSDYNQLGMGIAWLGIIAFTLEIYLDFSGYTDMAIGIGKMLGFKLPENFNYPYISRSVTDFWRRWHMSLTSWFRAFLFIPLEFARKKEKYFRQESNILIVFLLTGLWHGASWNYIIWGLYFGILLVVESVGFGKKLKKYPRYLQHFYTLMAITLGWIFFRITNISTWPSFFNALIGGNGWHNTVTLRTLNIIFYLPILAAGVVFSAPWVSKLENRIMQINLPFNIVVDFVYLGIFILAVASILSNGFLVFLYAQF